MQPTNIMVKNFLGKFYTELLHSAAQDKYESSGLDCFFDQSFSIQNNKAQMIVDPKLTGLAIMFCGNEIQISKELHEHKSIRVSNSIEAGQNAAPRNLYNPNIISTLAYLVCQNYTTLEVTETIDEPLYIRYKSEFETFYNSVAVVNMAPGIELDVVEEIESMCALNIVTNYIVNPSARLNLNTFYNNNMAATSFYYRNIMAQDFTVVNHTLFGNGSSNIIDETRIRTGEATAIKMAGIRNSRGRNFHSILYVDPLHASFSIDVNYKDIIWNNASVTYFPVLKDVGALDGSATIEVSDINLNEIKEEERLAQVQSFVLDIASGAGIEGTKGVDRFNVNKMKFLSFK